MLPDENRPVTQTVPPDLSRNAVVEKSKPKESIPQTIIVSIVAGVGSVLVSRVFHSDISAGVMGGIAGGLISVYFLKRNKKRLESK